MREIFPRIESNGARLVGVVCQKRSRVEAAFAADPLFFPMVIDETRAIAKRWGVYHPIGLDAFHIAHPASFVIDGAGIVRLAEVAPDQFTRTPLEAIIATLEACKSSGV